MALKDKNLYYVGGVVRDKILNTPSFDIDFCYEGNAIEFAQELNIIKTNPDFGTVRVLTDNGEIDIASTRVETYPKPGHLPLVSEIGCKLKDDLKRRDFTINALAQNTVTGEIIDYFNGLEDIKEKKLRVLHSKSFIDDPSRIIRGLKFAIRFDFELDYETKKLQEEYLANINYDLSFHRIKKEIKETFNLNSQKAFDLFIEQDIYKILNKDQTKPEINTNIEVLINKYRPENIWLVYAGLFDLSNLELTVEEKNILNSYKKLLELDFKNDYDIYKNFSDAPLESILLYAIDKDLSIATHYLDYLSKIKLNIDGNNLKELGIKPGQAYRKIFEAVLKEKINNPEMNINDEIEFIKTRFL